MLEIGSQPPFTSVWSAPDVQLAPTGGKKKGWN